MKDLIFLLITLGLICAGMMFAQDLYRGEEAEVNREWKRERFPAPQSPSSPSPSPSPTVTSP